MGKFAATAAVGLISALSVNCLVASEQPKSEGDGGSAPAFTAAQLSALPANDWITNGGNLSNQRFSPLELINRDNVGGLKAQWRTHLSGSGLGAQYSGQGQPIVYDGVIYVTTGASDVFALDVSSGEIRWEYKAQLDANRVRACCGWINRGVALGDGKIFVGQLDAQLVALDQRTGKVVWSTQAEDPVKGYSIVSAPLFYGGMIIVGFGGADMGTRGVIKAFDAKSGKLRWTFYTVPGPGELGHDTWPADNDAWKYGGASIWQTPAIDPELGMVYFSTGNAAPNYNGSGRKGDNLFTASILALDVKTGAYRWHFQQVHHDIWDYDSPNPVILFEAPFGGRMRKALAQVSKTGWVYILDRETGKPLLGIEERPVPQEPRQATAATQPFVVGDEIAPQEIDFPPEGFDLINHGRIFTPFWDKVVIFKPQVAANWPPSSYDPDKNRMFICGNDLIGSLVSDLKSFTEPTGHGSYTGGGGANPSVTRRGIFSAVDLKSNRVVWQQQWASGCSNGTLATKGGLIFVGRSDGRFTALDSDSGHRLWQFQTDAGVVASASTFLHKGTQYVVVLSAGTMFGGGPKGDSVWLFSLNGTIDSLPPPKPGAGAAAPAGIELPPGPADLAKGQALYQQLCIACHGDTGIGGHGGGPSLASAAKDVSLIANTAWAGKETMPRFRTMLSLEQLRDVSHYISDELFPTKEK
jgi:quinohemoprotein ethanol dehydrogenase